ncbi:MAG: T9SS type A sorting domain-containing protein [candidate division Zixibacteria bacterium]|nr:T9SS type A sorting domain-containing protein [candidate division Zixibacteria bacterium]
MKRFLIILLVFALAVAASADEPPTVTFDVSRLTVDEHNLEVTYDGLQPTSIGRSITLCGRSCLVVLDETERTGQIYYLVYDSFGAGAFEVANIRRDVKTTASDDDDTGTISLYEREKAGFEPVYIVGEVIRDGRRFASLLVFPVTIDSLGTLTFHPTIDIYVGTRLIAEEQLLSPEEVYKSWSEISDKSALRNSLSGTLDYVIVTCSALVESFAPLATYKSVTGYNTRVVAIDSVVTAYSGRDDAEKLREFLKDFYAQGGRYVLLGGDETNLAVRYAYDYRADEPPTTGQLQICDLYFADLTGDWDVDGDGIWGEKYDDSADIEPELFVGRLPFYDPCEVANYIDKLIIYETRPGGDNPGYLDRTFFFSSDQMRDYSGGGQHGRVAEHFPARFEIDTVNGVEQASGADPNPTNLLPGEVDAVVADGYGIVNIIAHGRTDGFVVKSANYNEWPKNYFLSAPEQSGHGSFDSMATENKPAFYYSIACNSGAFDFDQPSYAHYPNMGQYLLSLKGGAVGLVAQSRWGWVGSSYLLQQVFFDSLFAHPEKPAIEAMHASKRVYYYYRDLVLGQNFYGDPTLKVYTDIPEKLNVNLSTTKTDELYINVTSNDIPVAGCRLIIACDDEITGDYLTDNSGQVRLDNPLDPDRVYLISAVKDGYIISQGTYINLALTDVEDRPDDLPGSFELFQNYPNPFNPSTIISFELPQRQSVNLTVYNILGQAVSILVNEELSYGKHEINWCGCDDFGREVAGGVYFYRLNTEEFTASKKMILLR